MYSSLKSDSPWTLALMAKNSCCKGRMRVILAEVNLSFLEKFDIRSIVFESHALSMRMGLPSVQSIIYLFIIYS